MHKGNVQVTFGSCQLRVGERGLKNEWWVVFLAQDIQVTCSSNTPYEGPNLACEVSRKLKVFNKNLLSFKLKVIVV